MIDPILTHSTPRILIELPRAQLVTAQYDALDMFMFPRQNDPDFRAEEHCNRARIKRTGDRSKAHVEGGDASPLQ